MTSPIFSSLVALLIVLLLSPDLRAQRVQPRWEGPPLEEERLMQMLTQKYRNGRRMFSLEVVARAIRNRKVAFEPDAEIIAKLKSNGASDDILNALREVRPAKAEPVKPTAPAEPVVGKLAVRCSPAECSVLVDADPVVESKGGIFEKQVKFGKHTIVVARAGFGSEQRAVTVSNAAGETVTVTLKADVATKARFGVAIANQMVQLFGQEGPEVTGRGSWTKRASGIPEELSFAFRSGPKETVLIASSSGGGLQLLCEGESCQLKREALKGLEDVRPPRKQLKPEEARTLEAELRFFRRYLLLNMSREIRAGVTSQRLQASAESDQTGADSQFELQLTSSDERIALKLNSQYLPMTLTRDLGGNADRREVVTYSDYEDVAGIKFPKRISVQIPGASGSLIEVRLDRLK